MKLNIKNISLIAIFCALFMTSLLTSCSAAPLVIAQQGKSTFSIVVPKIAASSVNDAAAEMQRDIAESTGAKLPIIKDDEPVKGAFISLGSTKQAQSAGVSAKDIRDEGFHIVTKAGNLYIIGLDTTAIDLDRKAGRPGNSGFNVEKHPEIPGPAFTKNGGFSNGTANGVYTFLEDYLDVRWLMPGDIGRDVPKKSTFTIDNIDRSESSEFTYRVISLLGKDNETLTWRDQLKLGYSFRLDHEHAWSKIAPASLYKEHPDWFAMSADGKRLDPLKNGGKIETTNQELVKYVANEAIQAFKANPDLNTYSLSPNDGAGFSQSPESKALEEGAQGPVIRGPSMTPLMLKFYTDVSKIVAEKYPSGKLAGYFYSYYMYPPSQKDTKIPVNFVPVLTSLASGYGFYAPVRLEENEKIINEWGKIFPPNWFYYAFSTWMRGIGSKQGVITTAAPKFLNTLFGDLAKNHCKGGFFYGDSASDQTVMADYIKAKMLWNPRVDAVAIQRDWLNRAYGPQAGAIMEEFYNKMDDSWFSDYFRGPDSTWHNVSEAFYRQTYGVHYPEMEKLVLKAAAQPMTAIQKQRFKQVIGDNMRLLQWRLRKAGYIPADYSSPYTINTQQAFELLPPSVYSRIRYGAGVVPAKVQVGSTTQDASATIPNPRYTLLYPTKDGKVQLIATNVRPGGSFLFYYVVDENNKEITRGLLDNNTEITFTAKANTPYYFQVVASGVTLNPQDEWEISIAGATPAEAGFADGVVLLNASATDNSRDVYVYVPESLNRVAVNTATGTLIQPQTSEHQKTQAQRYARKAAEGSLEIALKKYQGSLVQKLDTGWKFTTDLEKTGEQQGFFKTDFADKSWKPMTAIGPWQSQGFDKYHGTGWYRKTFTVANSDVDPTFLDGRKLLLFVGAVDGDAVFYLNGQKIAERPQYDNSWQDPFALDVSSVLHEGKNTLAVQVTKDKFASGLYKGVSLIAGVQK
jgi:hypothetical protein